MSRPEPAGPDRCARCGRGVSPADFPAVARATLLLAAVSAAIRLLPFGVVHRWALGVRVSGRTRCPGCASRVVAAAAVCLRGRPTCLARAIVLVRMLRQRGRDARVVVGVSRHGGFAAHAWVEDGGHAVGDGALTSGRFAALEHGGSGGAEGSI